MLILSRRIGESLRINDNIEIRVIDISGDKIKLGIDAPREVSVLRSELCMTAEENRNALQSKAPASFKKFLQEQKMPNLDKNPDPDQNS